SKRIRQSRADRANGPSVSSDRDSGSVPAVGIAPRVVLSPVRPVAVDGPRIDPPVSEPSEPKHRPAAVAAAQPLDDVPTHVSGSQGLTGTGRPTPWSVSAASDIRSFPTMTAPAARSLLTASASSGST